MKINLTLAVVFLTILIYANINEMDGIVGLTKLDGGLGCQCHSLTPTDSVFVLIEGPDTVYRNDTAQFKISIYGGPAVVGGFNLASYLGTIHSLDTLTHLELNTATFREELTHSFPFPFLDGEVYWLFNYVAPDSIIFDTLYATGNSCNGDGIPTNLDQWNHSDNFVVIVIDKPVNVESENLVLDKFILFQNYPNPFNPSTTISYQIHSEEFINLTLYNSAGEEIAILVNETKQAGHHNVKFDGSLLSSGIYFYQLKADDLVETKKMVLIK